MGRELFAVDRAHLTYHEFPEDDHVSILSTRRDLIFQALNGRRG